MHEKVHSHSLKGHNGAYFKNQWLNQAKYQKIRLVSLLIKSQRHRHIIIILYYK